MEARPEKMKKSDVLGIFKRLLGYMIKNYKFSFLLVVICILITAVATMRGDVYKRQLPRSIPKNPFWSAERKSRKEIHR